MRAPGFRVLTADNERSARSRLRDLLSLYPECELIGEYANGADAMRTLEGVAADILFIDAETPGMNGFEVARAISGQQPLVILTAHRGDYAVRAFEAQAFDYLLKPIERSRFHKSLARAKTEVGRRSRPSRLHQLQPPERIAVRRTRPCSASE